MDAAEKAYEAAVKAIAAAKGGWVMDLSRDEFRALKHLPKQISNLTNLVNLYLNRTQISDLTPLAGMTGLQLLDLSDTQVSDLMPLEGIKNLQTLKLSGTKISNLEPLARMTGLRDLHLEGTQVRDLRPIYGLPLNFSNEIFRLYFQNTPATAQDKRLAELSWLRDSVERTGMTLEYLKTLPRYPEPLPWLEEDGAVDTVAKDSRKSIRAEPPITRSEERASAQHIKFLLREPHLTRITALSVATQIRVALENVPTLRESNELPLPLQSLLELADVLDRLGAMDISPSVKTREVDLRLRIAHLEEVVQRLTAQLRDSEAAKDTALALVAQAGFAANLPKEMAAVTADVTGFVIKIGVLTGVAYFLGATWPVALAFVSAVGAITK